MIKNKSILKIYIKARDKENVLLFEKQVSGEWGETQIYDIL